MRLSQGLGSLVKDDLKPEEGEGEPSFVEYWILACVISIALMENLKPRAVGVTHHHLGLLLIVDNPPPLRVLNCLSPSRW